MNAKEQEVVVYISFHHHLHVAPKSFAIPKKPDHNIRLFSRKEEGSRFRGGKALGSDSEGMCVCVCVV